MNGWHRYWFTHYAGQLEDQLALAEQCVGKARVKVLRHALASIKNARSHQPGKRGEDLPELVPLVNTAMTLCRHAIFADMSDEERKTCVGIADWWHDSVLPERHRLAFTIGLFVHYSRMIAPEHSALLTSAGNGAYGSVPVPLVDILTSYVGGADQEETIKHLGRAADAAAKWLPILERPEVYIIYGPTVALRRSDCIFSYLKCARNMP